MRGINYEKQYKEKSIVLVQGRTGQPYKDAEFVFGPRNFNTMCSLG